MQVRISTWVLSALLAVLCSISPLCLRSIQAGPLKLQTNPLSQVSSLLCGEFSSEVARKKLKDLEAHRVGLPTGWCSYLAATFALEVNDRRRYRKHMRLLKREDKKLYRLLFVTQQILNMVRRGRTQDHPSPLSPELYKACTQLMYQRGSFSSVHYSEMKELLMKQSLRNAARLVLRWQHSNEAILAFAEGLETLCQYRLVVLICQEIFNKYRTSTPSGKKAAIVLTRLIEVFGPRSRYLELMRKRGKKPRTREEIWRSIGRR